MSDAWRDMGTTMSTLYWSFYGLEPQTNADVVLPNSVVKHRTNETVHVDPAGHRFTEVTNARQLYTRASISRNYWGDIKEDWGLGDGSPLRGQGVYSQNRKYILSNGHRQRAVVQKIG